MNTSISNVQQKNRYIGELKEEVLAGKENSVPDEYRYLGEEWTASVKLGVDRELASLPESMRDMQVFERITDFDKFRLAYLDEYYTKRDENIGALGGAIFYLDSTFSVFRKRGDARLLAELRERGLRLGSKLSEKNVGVFVGNMAPKYPDKVLCRVGEENYIKLFSDYICYANYWREEIRQTSGVLLLVMPLENSTDLMQSEIDFLLRIEDISHEVEYPFIKERNQYLYDQAYHADALELGLNWQGAVIFATKRFEEEFGKVVLPGPPQSISQFMPELSYLMRCFDQLSWSRQNREVMLVTAEKKSRFYYMNTEILEMSNKTKGLKCVFQPVAKRKRNPDSTQTGSNLRFSFDDIIGQSESIVRLRDYARQIATGHSNVLILGESGTGKEMFAQAIHMCGDRAHGPFVPVNCASLSKELLNSELFGYEEGAFTGAVKGGAIGKFEQANGGTIFLDEIEGMPLDMQSALLRVLEDSIIVRVGGKKYIPVDIRVIAASNQDLWEKVKEREFRADLFFRLNVVTLNIPPLRERQDDIELLAQHLLREYGIKTGINKRLSSEVLQLFKQYSWPGNVREMRNMIERCLNYCQEQVITVEQMPEDMIMQLRKHYWTKETPAAEIYGRENWKDQERQKILDLLVHYSGNKSKTAETLGISRATLYKRIKEYKIE